MATETTDTIKHGETYNWSITAEDGNGDPVALAGTWTASLRVTKDRINGPVILTMDLDLTVGASNAVDTGDAPWKPGTYIYDIRFTDGDGNDFWSEPVRLVLEPRNTPAS